MFTGLIEDIGRVVCRSPGSISIATNLEEMQRGDSLAINGVCLTIADIARSRGNSVVRADVSEETARRTTLGTIAVGARVNVERALRADARLGGHVVLGHVDATVRLLGMQRTGVQRLLQIELPRSLASLIVEKGSVALDGVSLTVASVEATSFTVAIIPATWERTTLSDRQLGDRLNLEADVFARYATSETRSRNSVTYELLQRTGFVAGKDTSS